MLVSVFQVQALRLVVRSKSEIGAPFERRERRNLTATNKSDPCGLICNIEALVNAVSDLSYQQEDLPSMLRSWLLATLRFAVTLRSEDKLFLLGVAGELDKHGSESTWNKKRFNSFQRTSVDLAQAVASQTSEHRTSILRQHLVRIADERLKLAFAAAVRVERQDAKAVKLPKPKVNKLWKGLNPRFMQSTET